MKYLNAISIVFSLFLSATFANTAHAKENHSQLAKTWDLALTGRLIWTPKFTGSDEYEVSGDVSLDGYLSLSEQSTLFVNSAGIGLNYQLSDNLNTGILSSIRRDQNRSNIKHLDGLSNIDVALEMGSYLSYQLTDRLEISLTGLFDVSGTHDGWVVSLGVSHEYKIPNTPVTMTTLAGLDYANNNYNNTYYGLRSSATNIPIRSAFVVDSGFNRADLGTAFSYLSSEKISLIASITATQIIGDAKSSSVIAADTFITAGLGLTYIF